MCTCSLLELICQGLAGLWWGHVAEAGEGLLPRLLLPVPSLLPAPEAAGSESSWSHEQGPHLGKGARSTQKSAATWRMEVVLSFLPMLQHHHSIDLTLSSSLKLESSSRGGRDGLEMVEDQEYPPSRTGNEPGKTLAAAVSASAKTKYHGVPGGKHGILPRYVGARERGRSNCGEKPQPSHPTSKLKSLPNANTANKLETQESELDSKVRLRGQGVRNTIW